MVKGVVFNVRVPGFIGKKNLAIRMIFYTFRLDTYIFRLDI